MRGGEFRAWLGAAAALCSVPATCGEMNRPGVLHFWSLLCRARAWVGSSFELAVVADCSVFAFSEDGSSAEWSGFLVRLNLVLGAAARAENKRGWLPRAKRGPLADPSSHFACAFAVLVSSGLAFGSVGW